MVLDRTPPTVAIGVASASVKVGDLVSLQATASDATSGVAGAGQWTWGDNTGGGSGDAVTHTYTQPGTYEVALTVTDAAGNAATAKKTITVTAAGGGGTTDPPRRRWRDDEPARRRRRDDRSAAAAVAARPPARRRRDDAPPGGGGETPPAGDDDAPTTLELDAPRTARTRAKAIPVELTASGTGRVQLTLARGDRVVARAERQARPRRHRRRPPEAPQGPEGRPLHAEGDLQGGHRVQQADADAASRPTPARQRQPAREASSWSAGRARCRTAASTATAPRAPSRCADHERRGPPERASPSSA